MKIRDTNVAELSNRERSKKTELEKCEKAGMKLTDTELNLILKEQFMHIPDIFLTANRSDVTHVVYNVCPIKCQNLVQSY